MSYEANIIVTSNSVEMEIPDSEAFHAEERAGNTTTPVGAVEGSAAPSTSNLKRPLNPYGSDMSSVPRLYDLESALNVSKEVAGGYLVLLSGGTIKADTGGKSRLRKLKRSKKKSCCNRSSKGSPAKTPPDSLNSSSDEMTSSDTSSTRIPEDAIALAFMSLTDGNAIDTLFGVHNKGGIKRDSNTSKFAHDAARNAKEALREASYSSTAVSRIAVESYELCFEIIIDYNKKSEKLGLFRQCCQQEIIRGEAEESLEECFAILREAIDAAT